MPRLQTDSDVAIIDFVDSWVALLEEGEFGAAFQHTDHEPGTHWSPDLIREVIQAYGRDEGDPPNRVTLVGEATDIRQRKQVTRWEPHSDGRCGYVLYDLNMNGFASDLTALFDLYRTANGISVVLNDIHVM